jgi:hypothetical protein
MAHDDFETGPMRGLEKHLPEGESVLWQGSPNAWALAKGAMSIHWVIGYFAVLAIWRGLAAGVGVGLWYVVAGAVAAGLIFAAAWIFARATVYTITTGRVVMQIGAALTLSLNLPFRYIASAEMGRARDGTGSIHLKLKGKDRFSYLVLWPNVRPWAMRQPEPTLRCIPDVENVARLLGQAAEAQVGEITSEIEPAATPVAAE